jgi:hypothetical protein
MNPNPPPYYQPPAHGGYPLDPRLLRPSRWPKVFGILCVVFGAIAFLLSAGALVSSGDTQKTMMELGVPAEFFDRHWVAVKLMPIAATILGGIAVVGGSLLIARKKAGYMLVLVWAGLKIAYAVGQAPSSAAMTKELMPYQVQLVEAAQKEKGVDQRDVKGMVEAMAGVVQVLLVAWLAALPVVILIWFLRAKIRREVAGWTEGAAGSQPPADVPPRSAPPPL